MTTMKVKGIIMVVIMMLCIPINAQTQSDKTLVAYFSATGTTEKEAKLIVEVTGGTLYEIQPEKEYVTADLDWHDKSSRSSVEMSNAKSRPALKSKPESCRLRYHLYRFPYLVEFSSENHQYFY